MSRWEVEMDDGTKRVVEAATEQEAMASAARSGPVQAPGAAPTPETVSLSDRLKWGLSRGPIGAMQLVARGANYIAPSPTTQAWVDAPWDAAADEAYRRVFGGEPPRAPQQGELAQKVVGSVGQALGSPTGMVPGGGTAAGMAVEGAGLLLGSTAGAAAEDAGLPWWAQMGASIGASAVPGVGMRMAGSRAATAKVRGAARGVAESLPDRPAPGAGMALPNASPGVVQRASSEFKTMIPAGFEDEAANRLDDVLREFPDPATRPVTTQALDELGGETIESATMSLSRGDRTVGRNLAGQKLRAVRAIDDELRTLQPVGDMPTATSAYDDIAEQAAAAEREAWRRVPLDQMPQVPTRGLKQAAEEIRAGVGQAGAKNLPDELATVLEYGDNVPFSELQSLRSELLAVERAGRNPMATAKAARQGAHASRLRQSVEALIDDVAENNQVTGQPLKPGTAATIQRQEGVEALREAHRGTRENREIFDPRSPLVREMSDPKEAAGIARALLRGGPQDARRALSIFRSNDAAQDSVRRLVMDELIGPDILTEGAAKSAMKRLREKRQTAIALFGPEHVQNVERLLRKARTVRSGRAGTRGGSLGTGSNTLASDAIAKLESAMESVGQRGQRGMIGGAVEIVKKPAMTRLKEAFTHDREFSQVMAAAMVDPELARDLLRIPGPAAIPKWAERMNGHLVRNGIRLVPQAGQEPTQ